MFTRDRSPARGSSAHPVMRLVRTLVRLALFQAESPAAAPFIAYESTAAPALSWVRCHLLASHDYGVRSEPGRIFLACRHCGAQSRGVAFDEIPPRVRLRTAPAATARAATLDTRSDGLRTSHEPAVPGPVLAPAAHRARPTWRTAPEGGRAFIRRARGALVVGGPTLDLGAWAPGSPARVRVHAARDPPFGWRSRSA